MRILITGATGFVGCSLVERLSEEGCNITVLVRQLTSIFPKDVLQVADCELKNWLLNDLSFNGKMYQALHSIDVVIHLAARVHIMKDEASDPLREFRKVNRDASLTLAEMAAKIGVKRFIYLSSIGVNGDKSSSPFSELDEPLPHNDYAVSKYEAEQGLLNLAKQTGMEVVIIRPPLVYGPGVRANFASMMKWVNKDVPLPFGSIHNRRSLVALDNLVSFIIHCIEHPEAANEIFLISDDEDVSTPELLQKVAKSLGKQIRLIPVPVSWMAFAAKLIGKKAMANRLFGSSQVDISKAKNLLGWQPVITMNEQLKKTADAYLNKHND
ncbi:hypothetical protein LCGC14_0901490 [marine sediment metagenome]|uniref:NAD-dependent epimerase/dehydratase domain-containing protein n=1 Tax=marine sediment metagenome TaxID=412755 RepID=A0A0F9P1A0_9ZZZZ|nr:SDR family oxidoreductase [Methylophaga sp.]HEC58429.1 SDR family oxidoreductase [Methylophaga sp.]